MGQKGAIVFGCTVAFAAYTVWWVWTDKIENKALMRAGVDRDEAVYNRKLEERQRSESLVPVKHK